MSPAVARGRQVYPARRAVEHAVALDGVRPLRLFPVLWPLWQVETTANVYDEQAYEVIDWFVVRAVREAGFHRVDDLARFFGTPVPLVRRCLAFLEVIGHLRVEADAVRLTDLGHRAAAAGIRYVPKESRQDLYVEQYSAQPLPRRYYQGSVPIFATPEVPEDRLGDRSRFQPLFAPTAFQPSIVEELARRPDRTEFNLPRLLRELSVLRHHDAFLPAYVVETADRGLLVYTAVAAERDSLFEEVCRQVPTIRNMISAEERGDPREIWTAWLAEGRAGRGTLRQLPNGVWRATLRADAFGPDARLPLTRVGSFELRKRHFLQLWCDDAGVRRQAVVERALNMTRTADIETGAEFRRRIAGLARQLEVPAPTLDELRRYGREHKRYAQLARLDVLE
ncbi:hypothetical protein [Plantactinospora sp. B24E8]|uniref:hypothetical protein n=1 Tax=Plantactinospora sp. B24E8 TaxID=3153567 RepID=UPI00325F093A